MGMTMQGIDKLQMEMLRLMNEPNKKAGTAAISAGVNILAKTYRQNTPTSNTTRKNNRSYRQTGIAIARTPMKQAVRRKIRRGNKSRGPMAKVGYNVGKRLAPHAHLVTLGTRRRTTRTGQNRGVMPARPQIGRAVTAAIPQAIQKMREELKARLRSR